VYKLLRRLFHIGNLFLSSIFKTAVAQKLCGEFFFEICNIYVGKMVIKATKRIFNSDKICRSYSDLNFGVTFLEHSVYYFRRYIYQLNDILDLEPFTRD